MLLTILDVKLILDVATRWNSTFYIVERAALLKETVESTLALINKEIPTLTPDEWKIAADMCEVRNNFVFVLSIIRMSFRN